MQLVPLFSKISEIGQNAIRETKIAHGAANHFKLELDVFHPIGKSSDPVYGLFHDSLLRICSHYMPGYKYELSYIRLFCSGEDYTILRLVPLIFISQGKRMVMGFGVHEPISFLVRNRTGIDHIVLFGDPGQEELDRALEELDLFEGNFLNIVANFNKITKIKGAPATEYLIFGPDCYLYPK
jgi:hypothetical protein